MYAAIALTARSDNLSVLDLVINLCRPDTVSNPVPMDCQQMNTDRVSVLTNCTTEGAEYDSGCPVILVIITIKGSRDTDHQVLTVVSTFSKCLFFPSLDLSL